MRRQLIGVASRGMVGAVAALSVVILVSSPAADWVEPADPGAWERIETIGETSPGDRLSRSDRVSLGEPDVHDQVNVRRRLAGVRTRCHSESCREAPRRRTLVVEVPTTVPGTSATVVSADAEAETDGPADRGDASTTSTVGSPDTSVSSTTVSSTAPQSSTHTSAPSTDSNPPTGSNPPTDSGSPTANRSEASRTTDRSGSTSGPPPTIARSTGAAEVGWSPLTALEIVDPRDFGARGDGISDDTAALRRAVGSLMQNGGVVFVADGLVYKTTDVVRIDADHVKLWARSGRGRILVETGGAKNRQAVICQDVSGCGFHGVHFESDASRRLDALEDSQVVFDGTTDSEAVGLEIEGSASAAIFVYGRSTRTFVEGNYVHHSWADSVHFTNGSRQAWVWDNTFFNESPTKGDDGLACVTYGDDKLCGDMEWWDNRHLGSGWGRGFSVIGGERIHIHGNFARGIAGAGIIVASEPSYDTPGSRSVTIQNNVLFQTGQVIPHPGILVSALSAPISDITIKNNLVVDSANGEDFRQEGETEGVRTSNTTSSASLLPAHLPDIADGPRPTNTDVLKTRDTSFVPEQHRQGLYRIHVRRSANGAGFEQRFEYVIAGPPAALDRWFGSDGSIELVNETMRGPERFAVVSAPRPVTVPDEIRAVGFSELRAGDNDGSLADLWATLHP